MHINHLVEKLKNKIGKNLSFYNKDKRMLIIYYKNEEYKTFLSKTILNLCKNKDLEHFNISSYSNTLNPNYIYKDKDFFLNLNDEIKKSKKCKKENIIIFKDIDAFISDEKVVGLAEYINDFKNNCENTTVILMTNKRHTMKSFCKYEPSFLSIDYYGCLTEAACFDIVKKMPQESLKELDDDGKLLGEINED